MKRKVVSLLIQTERKSSFCAVPPALQPVYKMPLGALKEFYCPSDSEFKLLSEKRGFYGYRAAVFLILFLPSEKEQTSSN